MTTEAQRLQEAHDGRGAWKKWSPYLSERQWGTVREDYSEGGNAWDYFTHDQARSRAYHWGEDGLGGISDSKQLLCFALALWNGRDPIIKERLFGLTNSEGNHGEDVKEYYFYLDSTPTHSYMKYLYKYPQAAYPYDQSSPVPCTCSQRSHPNKSSPRANRPIRKLRRPQRASHLLQHLPIAGNSVHVLATLPVALSDQHSGLADRAVPPTRSAGNSGRYSRCRTR